MSDEIIYCPKCNHPTFARNPLCSHCCAQMPKLPEQTPSPFPLPNPSRLPNHEDNMADIDFRWERRYFSQG